MQQDTLSTFINTKFKDRNVDAKRYIRRNIRKSKSIPPA